MSLPGEDGVVRIDDCTIEDLASMIGALAYIMRLQAWSFDQADGARITEQDRLYAAAMTTSLRTDIRPCAQALARAMATPILSGAPSMPASPHLKIVK